MIVTCEQAKHLESLGFDGDTCHYYDNQGKLHACEYWDYYRHCSIEYEEDDVFAPTVEDALEYLRNEHFFMGYVEMSHTSILGDNRKYNGKFRGVYLGSKVEDYIVIRECDTHSEALLNLLTFAIKAILMRRSITEGDYFTLSSDVGYTPSQRKTAMQIMECSDRTMTVKCSEDGCMTKPYYHFEKIEDITQYKVKFDSPNLEDCRTKK